MRDVIAIFIQGSSILLISYLTGLSARKHFSKLNRNRNVEQDNPISEGKVTHSTMWGNYGIGVMIFIIVWLLVARYTDIITGTMIDAYIFSGIFAIYPLVTIPLSYRFNIKFNQEYLEVRSSYGLKHSRLYFKDVTIDPNVEFLIITSDLKKKTYMIGFAEPGVTSLELAIRKYHKEIGKTASKEMKLSKLYKPLLIVFAICSLLMFGLGVWALVDHEVGMAVFVLSLGSLMLIVSIVCCLYYTNVSIEIIGQKVVVRNLLGKPIELSLNELSYSNRKYGVVMFHRDKVVYRSIGKSTNLTLEIETHIKHR